MVSPKYLREITGNATGLRSLSFSSPLRSVLRFRGFPLFLPSLIVTVRVPPGAAGSDQYTVEDHVSDRPRSMQEFLERYVSSVQPGDDGSNHLTDGALRPVGITQG
jgi:hypothetical protein